MSWYESIGNAYKEVIHATAPIVATVGPAFGPYGIAVAAAVNVQDRILNKPANPGAPTSARAPTIVSPPAQPPMQLSNISTQQLLQLLQQLQSLAKS